MRFSFWSTHIQSCIFKLQQRCQWQPPLGLLAKKCWLQVKNLSHKGGLLFKSPALVQIQLTLVDPFRWKNTLVC